MLFFQFSIDIWAFTNILPDTVFLCPFILGDNRLLMPFLDDYSLEYPDLREGLIEYAFCNCKFWSYKVWSGPGLRNVYLLFHLFVVHKFYKEGKKARIQHERDRVKKIWKDMLRNKRNQN